MNRESYVKKIPGPGGHAVEIIIPGEEAGLTLDETRAMIELLQEFTDALRAALGATLD